MPNAPLSAGCREGMTGTLVGMHLTHERGEHVGRTFYLPPATSIGTKDTAFNFFDESYDF